jgi:CRP-like cAMP-binding protein
LLKLDEHFPIANSLLAKLPLGDYQRLQGDLELVTLPFGEVLYEPEDPINHVHFLNDALVSLLTMTDHRHAIEVGLVGREGMVGVSVALGVPVSPFRITVQGTGTAMRMQSASFRHALMHSQSLQHQVYLYTHVLMSQVAQTAACNHFHVVEARLARWLLMTRDRIGSNHFHLTHEFLGHMLGVRREGVTNAALALKQQKLIMYSRGSIDIIDGAGLEAASCSCYELLKVKLN